MASPRGDMAIVGPLLGLTSSANAMAADSDPRWTGAAKVRPASVEQTATTSPTMSPEGSWWVVQSHTAQTSPEVPAAIWGPALIRDATVESLSIRYGEAKVWPPSVDRASS